MNIDEAINAFAIASGVTSDHVSLLIRTLLCALFLLWAAWNVYGQLQLVHANAMDSHDLPTSIFRVLFLCALMIVLIYVS